MIKLKVKPEDWIAALQGNNYKDFGREDSPRLRR